MNMLGVILAAAFILLMFFLGFLMAGIASRPVPTPTTKLRVRCQICKTPAKWHEKEKVWRHEGRPFEGAQIFCDRFGYPIDVETDEDRVTPE